MQLRETTSMAEQSGGEVRERNPGQNGSPLFSKVKTKRYGGYTRVSVFKWLETAFEANEVLKPNRKRTDPEMYALLRKEFPDHWLVDRIEIGKESINTFRNQLNSGKLTGRLSPVYSFRYNKRGLPVHGRMGHRVLTPEEVARSRKEHQERYVSYLENTRTEDRPDDGQSGA
jgi:hypothetical protein